MSEFRFAEPQWAYALWGLLGLVVLLFWLERRGGGALQRFVSEALQPRLVARPSAAWRNLRIALLGLAAAFLIAALMRPQWGLRQIVAPRIGAEIMILLDVSRSMLAEDVAPNRLERSKAEIVDLLGFLDRDQVGLIAFAGRAVVLSPLTPDFSFLRIVLDEIGIHSVTRGGTRIGDAIRKAVAGFAAPGEASRAILLITDGEDHDSFPRDAAKLAAEQGIRIIAIGFGDEAGAEIYVTDPRTGARSKLLDGRGDPVVSRLDGELLRDLAQITGGAYVPAGTGVLALQSIYERHIAPLTRGQLAARGRSVRDEGYQWAVLLALVFLVASAAVAGGSRRQRSGPRPSGPGRSEAAALAFLLALGPASAPYAQEAEVEPAEATVLQEPATLDGTPEPELPRDLYNRGVGALAGDNIEEAERWLQRAHREAKGDGELRARATYNLGWISAKRAETLEPTEPEEALRLLYRSADWFREAVQQRPEYADARQNLEVVLRRALILADQLAQGSEDDLEQRLEELAERQRGVVVQSAGLLEQLPAQQEFNVEERFRRDFRAVATVQRTILSDADGLAAEVGEERDLVESRLTDAKSLPDDAMRVGQLDRVLHYLHRARERMGQTRRQLRQRQAERAYRRASASLAEIKRALEQLRDPVAILDGLIRDEIGLGASTSLLAASRSGASGPEPLPEPPPWLTGDWLVEGQSSVAERTEELSLRLRAGIEQPLPEGASPALERVQAAAREAEPFVVAAHGHLARAAAALEEEDLEGALEEQGEGLRTLAEARERFLDVRGLIEAIYTDEKRIEVVAHSDEEGAEGLREGSRDGMYAAQRKNLERAGRLAEMLRDERANLGTGTEDAADDEFAQRAQLLEVATDLLSKADGAMNRVRDELGDPETRSRANWEGVRNASHEAVQHLEGLRRLFFSITEHIRDVAKRQVDLLDETQDAAALSGDPDDASTARLNPLASSQRELAQRSEQIALALEEQSRQEGDVMQGEADAEETTRRLRLAAEHVLVAGSDMSSAAANMEATPPKFDETRGNQGSALDELREALALLSPPGQGDEEGGSRQPGDAQASEGQNERGEEEEQTMDSAQLLQAVRDREAQRRRDRANRQSSGYETVEKDW